MGNDESVRYEPADSDANTVHLNPGGTDETVVVESSGYTTDDPALIAALDAEPSVQRVAEPASKVAAAKASTSKGA